MIGFASIAGGAPSSVKAMADHLLNHTVPREMARVADYYDRGTRPLSAEDRVVERFGQMIAAGEMAYSEALDSMLSAYISRGGDVDRLHVEEDRLHKRLVAAVEQAENPDAPMATVRPDMHPIVAQGLGIELGTPLGMAAVSGLLAGRRADGEKIEGKHYATERDIGVNPKTGERRSSTPIGAYDFCPTPDKSVSVAWAFAEPSQQAAIFNAHREAAREAVAYIAAEIGRARIGKGGQAGYEAGHVGWLEFSHFTARRTQITVEDGAAKVVEDKSVRGDPDMHTHFLIPNAVFCESGRVGSLDSARIAGFIFEADAFYQAQLGQNLRDAGFDVVLDPRTGAARMPAVPEDACKLFSKRTNVGEFLAREETRRRGEDWTQLSEAQRDARIKAATQSRDQKVKGDKDDVADFEGWRKQAKQLGWEPTNFLTYGPAAPKLSRDERLRMAYDESLPFVSKRFEQDAVVAHWDVRVAAARGLVASGIIDVSDINAVTRLMREHGVEQYGERTALAWGKEDGRRYVSVTTALHESQEKEFVELANAAAVDRSAALPTSLLRKHVAASGLDFSGQHGQAQLRAVERLGTGGRLGVMLGAAGAGKTALLRPLVAAWKEQGRAVHGVSLAWRQADDLADAGISQVKAFSVFLDAAKAGRVRLDRNSVVVVDELALLGTRQGLELLRLRDQHGFVITAMGDDKQCASIEAGAIVELCRRALGPEQIPQILTTIRQQTEREREIAGLFRDGKAREAIDMKRSDGSAEMVPGGYNETAARVAKLYADRVKTTGEAPTISVPTNYDAHRVSVAVRQARRELGQLGADIRTLRARDMEGRDCELTLAKGDRVRLFKSTGAKFATGRGGNIGRNGSVLEVVDLNQHTLTARSVKTGRVGEIKLSDLADSSGRVLLAYGDVLTIHTAQGSTAKEHIFALPDGSQAVNGLQAYTAGSRHRQQSYLLVSESAERKQVRERRPINDPREVTLDDKWANVARNFAKQPEKDTAIAMMERVEKIRRGSVRAFHRVMHTAERRKGAGLAPSNGHELTERHRLSMSPAVKAAAAYVHAAGQTIIREIRASYATRDQVSQTQHRGLSL